MCGIVGIVNHRFNSAAICAATERMTNVIVHRGPNDQGQFAIDGFGIGMRRLSIIDLAGGHQPISNETGEIHIVCNGEIYNFVELRTELVARGHQFKTHSDTEVVLHLYEEHGDRCLQYLRGMFGLAILDTRGAGRLLVARDRLGKKPIFTAHVDGALYLGSEMKSILAVAPELAEPDYSTLAEYFQFGYIRQPKTIYRHIQRLPAGHFGVFENGRFTVQDYWRLSFDVNDSLTEAQWRQELDATLQDSVRIRMRSDVPLGVFLSGGLDSSTIVAYASQQVSNPMMTFTIGFDRPEWDESEDAARVARHFGTDHHLLRLSEAEMRNALPETLQKIVFHCDEPFGDTSALPTYIVSRLARQHATVILSGDGGDELFAGYTFYRGMLFAQQYRRYLPFWLGRKGLPGAFQLASRLMPSGVRYKSQRIAKVLRDSALPLEQAYRDKSSIWQASELQDLISPDLISHQEYLGSQFLPDELMRILRSDRELVGRLTEIDIQSYMLDDILVKVDRMSMAHSLEVRSPLLDYKVVELAARMPTAMKIRNRQGKHILREVVGARLPPAAVRKGKQGFSVPLRDWFRGQLNSYVEETLGPHGMLPTEIFNQAKVQQTLREHREGRADNARKIWLLLTFAAWHQQYQTPCALRQTLHPSEAVTCAS
jgi:asparagine synthase (glutamine-hydrolysing)